MAAPSPRPAVPLISKRQIFGIAWKAGLLSDLPPLQRIMFLIGVLLGGRLALVHEARINCRRS